MTTVAVMQPTFLPWLGYLDLMDQVDHFVYLDSVQFSRQSWQQRNRIRTAAGLSWITVPTDKRQGLGTRIDEVQINHAAGFPQRCVAQLVENYRRAPHWPALGPVIERLERAESDRLLVDLLLDLLDALRTATEVTTPTLRSSQIGVEGRRSELVVSLLRELGCTRYVSPPGALEYLRDDAARYEQAGIEVVVHRYEHPEYPQQLEPFLAHASAVDLVANLGPQAPSTLRSGRCDPTPLAAAASMGATP